MLREQDTYMYPPLNNRHMTEKELFSMSPFKLKYIHIKQVNVPPSKESFFILKSS